MTPAARYATAAVLLDEIETGRPAEQVLTNWARQNRYAGSGDRAAVRDVVFDGVRRWRSSAMRGGGETGRARVLGLLRERSEDVDAVFCGAKYALDPLTSTERNAGKSPEGAAALDVQDWLVPLLEAGLGSDLVPVCQSFRDRADLFVRWNAHRTNAQAALAALEQDGIAAEVHALSPWALRIVSGGRRLRQSAAFGEGLVEIQDAASQAVCAALPVSAGSRVLDYCAGGGGKSLALAAMGAEVFAHDADPARMTDLPVRAQRAGLEIRTLPSGEIKAHAPYDLVLTDVPCSGSGAWRRQPEAKWALTPERLTELTTLQVQILAEASDLVRDDGWLAYATCSILSPENTDVVSQFERARPGDSSREWTVRQTQSISPTRGGDGFFLALLARTPQP